MLPRVTRRVCYSHVNSPFQPAFTAPAENPHVRVSPLTSAPAAAPALRSATSVAPDAVGSAVPARLPTREDLLRRVLSPEERSQDFHVRWETPVGGRLLAPPAVSPQGALATVNDDGLAILGPEGEVRVRVAGIFDLFSTPVFTKDGGVLVASPKRLSCYDGTGGLRWSQDVQLTHNAPAVDADGHVYAAGKDGVLHSFEADGRPRWSHDLTPQVREVYRDNRRDWAEKLRQDLQKPDLDPEFRKSVEKWLREAEAQIAAPDAGYQGPPKIDGGPSLGPDGSVYVFTEVGPLYRFHPDGRLEREERLPTWLQARGVGFTPEGGVLGVGGNSVLMALRPDGSLDFEYSGFAEERLDRLPPEKQKELRIAGNMGASTVPRLSPDGKAIYFAGMDGKVRAIDRSGNKLWTRPLDSYADVAVGSDGTVYGVSTKGLSAFSPGGRVLWSYETRAKHCHVAVNGQDVILTTYDGKVFALDSQHYRRMAEVALNNPAPADPVRIQVGDGWVTIGGVRLPQR